MSRNKRLALLSIMIALELLFAMVPFLGYIPLGFINATTLHIPVILTAIILGGKEAMLVGLVFGMTSLLKNTLQPNLTSFLFTPAYTGGNFWSLVICFVPRILMGLVAAYLFNKLLDKVGENISLAVSAFLGAFVNTLLVMGLAYFCFGSLYGEAIGIEQSAVAAAILGVIFTNGVVEALVAAVIAVVVGKVARRLLHL